jgi:two-component system chemotaxis response regulator CheY
MLCLDASAVEVLTVPCIQVLMVAGQDGRLQVLNPSPEFTSAFQDLSLQEPQQISELPEAPLQPEPQVAEMPVAAVAPVAGSGSGGAQRILIIDDSKTMRDMLRITLSGAGYDLLQGVDGQDGIEVLGDQMVDAVITDINMPRMDGYEVIRALRKKRHLDPVPILVLTTESEKDKRNIAREAGATGWMVKPFDPEKLIATLRKVLPEIAPAAELVK